MNQNLLKTVLHYEPLTGVFTWKYRPRELFKSDRSFKQWNSGNAGKAAGWLEKREDGYEVICISIFGRRCLAHRLAWLYMTGDQPPKSIDHKNRISTDNRWDNLRDGKGINDKNKSLASTNTSGEVGATYDRKRKKWKASGSVRLRGKSIKVHLGMYESLEEAADIARAFRELIGYEKGHGKPRPY